MIATDPYPPVVTLLQQLVRFKSLSHDEAAVAEFCARTLAVPPLRVEQVDNNVIARLGTGERAFLLNTHLDVVPPSDDHPYPAFGGEIHDGCVFGRGSVDAKASVAAMTTALLDLAESGWLPPSGWSVVLALTACEEVGGGYNGLEAVRPLLPTLEAAIIGEPTELAPCTAQKGMLLVEAVSKGRTAHAARPHLGVNALVGAARDVIRLDEFTFDRQHPLLGETVANVTVLRGGSVHNVIPDQCTYTIDARIAPAYTSDEVLSILREMLDADLSVRSNRYVPVETDHCEPIVRAAVAASGKEPFGSPTASDWVYVRDVPTVKLGPGDSNRSHTAGERIEIDELAKGPDVYRAIIEEYFQVIAG